MISNTQGINSTSGVEDSEIKDGAFVFKNWAATVTQTPDFYYEPCSTEEIQEIVRKVIELNKSGSERHIIRVIGKGHSPNDICIH